MVFCYGVVYVCLVHVWYVVVRVPSAPEHMLAQVTICQGTF